MSKAKVTISLSSTDLLPQTLSLRASRQLTIGRESALGTVKIANSSIAYIYPLVNGGVGADDITYIFVSADSTNAGSVLFSQYGGVANSSFNLYPGEFLWLPVYNNSSSGAWMTCYNATGSDATIYYYFGERE